MGVETAAKPDPAGACDTTRRCAQFELWVGYTLILIVIWTPRPWQKDFYFVAATFVVAATWRSFPGWEAMGFGLTNLLRSLWIIAAALLATAVAVFVSARMHTLHAPSSPREFFARYSGYILFAIVQQALLQDYFLLRFQRLLRTPQTALASAAIFSLAHLPNPILTICTFVWGLAACLFFLRYRNLYSLAVAHAILGITLAMCVPGPTIRNMRVGLGYLTYHAPLADHRSH